MKIVIDIPKRIYDDIKTNYEGYDVVYNGVKNGKQIPKKHGRLIDADEVQEVIEFYKTQYDGIYQLPQQIDVLPTIIEAERDCKTCAYSKDGHLQGVEECHLCMWKNQYIEAESARTLITDIGKMVGYERQEAAEHDESRDDNRSPE